VTWTEKTFSKRTTFLIAKTLLAAKMNKGFKVYVVPLNVSGIVTVGLISAFFEDPESPLTVWTPLANEPATKGLIAALLSGELKVHLFDEHELLGYAASVDVPLKARMLLEHAKLHDRSHHCACTAAVPNGTD
jgi:hypothetical protein